MHCLEQIKTKKDCYLNIDTLVNCVCGYESVISTIAVNQLHKNHDNKAYYQFIEDTEKLMGLTIIKELEKINKFIKPYGLNLNYCIDDAKKQMNKYNSLVSGNRFLRSELIRTKNKLRKTKRIY